MKLYAAAVAGAIAVAAVVVIVVAGQGPNIDKTPKFDAALLQALPEHPNISALLRRPVPSGSNCAFGDVLQHEPGGVNATSVYCDGKPQQGGLVADIGNKTASDYHVKEDTVTCKDAHPAVFCLVVHKHALVQWQASNEQTTVDALGELIRIAAEGS